MMLVSYFQEQLYINAHPSSIGVMITLLAKRCKIGSLISVDGYMSAYFNCVSFADWAEARYLFVVAVKVQP